MGWPVIIAYALIAIASVATYFLTKPSSQLQGDDLSPNSLDAFNITMAQEGTVVPLVFGIVRVNTNLLYYGGLTTETLTETVSGGGKGGGGSDDQDIITGYRYRMDFLHGVCIGVINILKIYYNDKEMYIDAAPADPYAYTTTLISRVVRVRGSGFSQQYIYQNPGCSTYQWTGQSNPSMIPVSTVWMNNMWLGDNVNIAPTFHMVVEKRFPSGYALSYPRHATYGTNPAAIIYELLLASGESASSIDTTTFEEAAAVFHVFDSYLSLSITGQGEWREHIKRVISNYVDATLRKNWQTGKYELIAHKEYVDADYGFTQQDFVDFSFNRPGWDDTYNDLRANYTDRNQAYSRRTIRAYNSGSIQLLGYSRQKTIDLTAFNDITVASRRLWELLKRFSYPLATIKFKTGLWGARAPGPGQLIGVIHDEYGINNSVYRVIDKRISEEDQNYIDWICEEDINNTFSLGFQQGGDPGWTPPDYDAAVCVHEAVFELPYNPTTLDSKAFVCLAAREGNEVAFSVMYSNDAIDYASVLTATQWSMYGTLDVGYDDETEEIDDDVGILFTPYNEEFAPTFSDVSRTNLYNISRVAIIGNEVITFQTMTPEGASSYRLLGVIRGVYNTPIEQHASSAAIWITSINSNNTIVVNQTSFYLKYLPQSVGGGIVDIGDASQIDVTGVAKAEKPYPPWRIVATRTGTSVQFDWLPVTRVADGAGTKSPNTNLDSTNLYEGDFYFDAGVGSHDQYVDGMTLTITQSGAFTVTIYNRVNNVLSVGAAVSVGSADGEYVGPEITYT